MCGPGKMTRVWNLHANFRLFSRKTAAMLKRTALVDNPDHVVHLLFSTRRGQWLIDDGCMLVGILPVCCSDQKLEGGRNQKDEKVG